MKRHLLALCVLVFAPAMAAANIRIVTTTTDFADLARQIGRDKVEVHSVMKGPENVHNVMAKPTEMLALNRADLFVHSGLDSEPWRDNLLKGARNPRVAPGKAGNVDMSVGIELREVPAGRIDRSQGDVHAYGNPHYQLSPQNAQRMTATLVAAMAAVDPGNAGFYKENAKRLVTEMADVTREVRSAFAPYAGLKVVTFHKAWDYFADAVDVKFVGTIEPKPGITPSGEQVRQVIEMMKREGVRVIVCETYNDDDLARRIAEKAGAKLVVLPDHVNGVAGAETYPKLFRHNVAKLIEAAKAAGVEPAAARP